MKNSWKLGRLCGISNIPRKAFLIVPTLVALAWLATVAVLASAVSATFLITAALGGVFVALFVIVAARRDARRSAAETCVEPDPATTPRQNKDEAMSLIVLPAHARADEVTGVLFTRHTFFPVARGGKVVGVVSKSRLLWAVANGHGDRLLAELMNYRRGDGPQHALATVRADS